ncbi:N-acetylmuramoyl-L-alanine amidase family protein [Paenibacillus sp. GYB003]|uniref:N-acetylmuramoyl-L-alanine amidase family protein n=1 Tax=Paenibacillus sp. GYB003 TaxID=2994392 RepID=UPI002F96A3AB
MISKKKTLLLAAMLLLGSSPAPLTESAGAAPAETGGAPVVCLDPGHQERASGELEPVGPGSRDKKPRVTAGTRGVATGKPEYELNLEVSVRIKDKLEAKGFAVVMTRQSHDVDISNKERAEAANAAGADLFVRIHADGDASPNVRGASALYPSEAASATAEQYARSKAAADIMLADMVRASGAKSRGTAARGDLAGFNWSTVPNVLIELGFMTNAEEDRLLATEEYQEKLAAGIADGIERYMTDVAGKPAWNPAPFDDTIALLDDADLHERVDGRLVPVGARLGPQPLRAREKAGHWYRVDTWLGSLWIYAPSAVIGTVERVNETVVLAETTPLYPHPSGGEPPIGELAPQPAEAFEAWGDWVRIRTWLGDAWIRRP